MGGSRDDVAARVVRSIEHPPPPLSRRPRTGVGHGQQAGLGVLQREVLVRELGAVDGLATGAVACGGEQRKRGRKIVHVATRAKASQQAVEAHAVARHVAAGTAAMPDVEPRTALEVAALEHEVRCARQAGGGKTMVMRT